MAALVAAYGNGVGILLNGGFNDFAGGPVVGKMDHLCAGILEDPPHDIDRYVVAVEERRSRDDPPRDSGACRVLLVPSFDTTLTSRRHCAKRRAFSQYT